MEPDDNCFLDLIEQCKDILTENHPHYRLNQRIWDSARNRLRHQVSEPSGLGATRVNAAGNELGNGLG